MNHTVSDFVIRIKNAYLARRKTVILPYSKFCKEIGKVLVKEKFLADIKEHEKDGKKELVATLIYQRRTPVFTQTKILSRPSLRVYANARKKKELMGKGLEIVVVSTSKGVMTGKEAMTKNVGGELLFTIY